MLNKWFGFARDEVFDQGVRAAARGDDEQAIEIFEAVLSRPMDAPRLRAAASLLAASYRRLGDHHLDARNAAQAIAHYQRALKLTPNYPDLHLALAVAHRSAGQAVAEATAVAEALRLHPEFGRALLHHASLLVRDGRTEEAEAVWRAACEREPRAVEAWGAYPDAVLSERLFKASLPRLDKAQIHAALGQSFARDRRFDAAARELRRAVEECSHYPDLRLMLGNVLLELNRPQEAEPQFREAIRLHPNLPSAHAGLARATWRQGKREEARQALQRAITLDPAVLVDADDLPRADLL